MQKVLFVDRDGTIIVEPKDNFQVDSLEKLEFIPYAISALKKLSDQGYELVMVSNQDGRGTASFPEENFIKPHLKMLKTLKNEGVEFQEIFIDPSFEEEKSINRKPNIGMLIPYLQKNNIDLENSYVIGDRTTDIQLAKNIGCKSILLSELSNTETSISCNDWKSIVMFLEGKKSRKISLERKTNETQITLELNLDGAGRSQIFTGINFYDHMLEQLTKHSGIDLSLVVKGDLEIDEHHTIEDSAIALGTAFKQALGDKKGIERYGFVLPMDDALASCAIDFSGRPWLVFDGKFDREYVGDFPTEMLYHWLKTFADSAGLNVNIKVSGENTHHKVESVFKCLAKSIKQAIKITSNELPTTKGVLA